MMNLGCKRLNKYHRTNDEKSINDQTKLDQPSWLGSSLLNVRHNYCKIFREMNETTDISLGFTSLKVS